MTEENDNENARKLETKKGRMGGFFFYFRSLIFLSFLFFFPIPPLPFLGLLIYWKDQSEKGELLMA